MGFTNPKFNVKVKFNSADMEFNSIHLELNFTFVK